MFFYAEEKWLETDTNKFSSSQSDLPDYIKPTGDNFANFFAETVCGNILDAQYMFTLSIFQIVLVFPIIKQTT